MAGVRYLYSAGIEADAVAEATHTVRRGLIVIALFFLGVGGWAAFAPIAGSVIAQGVVMVDMNRKTVQHQEGGTVREIRVRPGDRVRAGQVLFVMEDVRVDAAVEQIKTQVDSERTRSARALAEQSVAEVISFPDDLVARAEHDPKVAELLQRESALFKARRQTLREQGELIRRQKRETEVEAAALARQTEAESRALTLQRDELAANRRLMSQGFVGEIRVKTVDRAAADYEARVSEHQAEIARARQRASELALRLKNLENQYSQAAADELKDSANKLFDLEERLRPSKDAAERQKIVAPIAGEVVDLRVTSPGAVIGPRDPLVDIVPADSKLLVEGRIRPEDIDYVRVGSDADVRLTAFKARTTPVVEGKVVYVAADRLVDRATNAPYYQVHVDVPPAALTQAGGIALRAGMPAEIYIKTAERTALQYLLEPMTAFLRRSLREP
jgi:HlyD family type I secretion membrane fusion protein